MTDEPTKPAPAGAATTSASMPVFTEQLPSAAGQISGIASANAPFLFFDNVPFSGQHAGIGMLTLTATRYIFLQPDGGAPPDHAVVAHLRGSMAALKVLRDGIDRLLMQHAQMPATETAPQGTAH